MRFTDRIVAAISPEAAVRRAAARMMLDQYARYEATRPTPGRKVKKESRGPNSAVQMDGWSLAQQARYLEQNHDLAESVLATLIDNVVGEGITPEPMVKTLGGELHDDANTILAAVWEEFAKRPTVQRDLAMPAVQELQCRSLLRDGEFFTQHLRGRVPRLQHGSDVLYSIDNLEREYCPDDLNSESPTIVQGVEMNGWSRPVAYHIYRNHPLETTSYRSALISRDQIKREPAFRINHVRYIRRFRQVRGVSVFANSLHRLQQIGEIEHTELTAARVAATMTAFVRKGDPYMFTPPPTNEDGTTPDYAGLSLGPGMVAHLQPGEDIATVKSERPNVQVVEFMNMMGRRIAGGTGANYSSMMRLYDNNYSAQRQELVEGQVRYGRLWCYFTGHAVQPVYENVIDMAVGRLIDADLPDVDPTTWKHAYYPRPRVPWIDPAREMNAFKLAHELKAMPLDTIIRMLNLDPRDVREQFRREEAQQIQTEQPTEDPDNAPTDESGDSEDT